MWDEETVFSWSRWTIYRGQFVYQMILCPYMPTGKDDPAVILVQVQMLSVFYYLLFV